MDTGYERIAELVVKLQGGDNNAFNELYKLTSGRAYFVALEITKNEQDAEDVLQESYIKMLEKINTLDKPESFVSWFHHIVANKSKDSLKKKKPTLFEGGEDEAFEVIPDEDTSFSPEESLNQDELHSAVMEVIGELTEEKRACVMMMYFEEMSVNEISESLEIPVSTVKNRLFTARKDLKAKFEKRGITSLYSTAPIGVVIWALTRASDSVSSTFAESANSARVLSGIAVSGTAAAATAAAGAGTAATATTAAAATTAATTAGTAAASTGAGVAAKILALTTAQKVLAGLAAVGIIGGTAAGVTTVVRNSSKEPEPTGVVQEEVTTAPDFEEETALPAVAPASETSTSVTTAPAESTTKTEGTTAKATTTKKPTTTENKTTAKKETTTKKTTTTTKKTTTTTKKETTTKRETTTRKVTTTAEPTTQEPTTTRPTTTTTTEAPDATVTIQVIDLDDSVVDTFSVSIEPGTVINEECVAPIVQARGYTPYGGFEGTSDSLYAESGSTYSIKAYL